MSPQYDFLKYSCYGHGSGSGSSSSSETGGIHKYATQKIDRERKSKLVNLMYLN